MNEFREWGFRDTPFVTKPLKSDKEGEILLVGRDSEVKKIRRRLTSGSNILTVEGANGVGKTSLINVAVYKEFKDFIENEEGQLFFSCVKNFQLQTDSDNASFVEEVYMAIAQTLISKTEELKDRGYTSDKAKIIDRWLNDPLIKSYSSSLSGFGLGKNVEQNATEGYHRSGFKKNIEEWLNELFPDNSGGVVCIIDNMELLETSKAAKKKIEFLRDSIFQLNGIKWVLCGSLGIIKGIVSSPRMGGFLHSPIEVEGINPKYADNILNSRIKNYSSDEENAYLPIASQDFSYLYKIVNNNIRNCLSYANDYCLWIMDEELKPETNDEKHEAFIKWLDFESMKYDKSFSKLRPNAVHVFKEAIKGPFASSDYEKLGFKSAPALRPYIVELEDHGLIASLRDEDDSRRKTIQVTPKGWFVNYLLDRKSKNGA